MNIELQLKNTENPKKNTYKPLNNEETDENNEDKIINDDKNLIESNIIEEKEIKENIIKKWYNKIKIHVIKIIKKLFKGIFYCLLTISVILYIASLEGCEKEALDECLVDDRISNYVRAGIKLLVCCGIMACLILIQILLKYTKVNYILIIIPYAYLFYNYTGVDLKNHGTYNSFAFIIVTPCLMLLFYIIYYMFYSFYNKKYIRASIIFSIFAISFIVYYSSTNCDNFYKGLGGVDLENNRTTDKCYMIRPKYCSMKFIDPFFDMSVLKGDCKGRWNTRKRFMKYLRQDLKNINHFYYPRIEYAPIETFTNDLFYYVFRHIGGVKENPAEAEKAEVFLDFENDKGTISINVKRNETLIEQRRALAEKNEVKFDNVYVFFIDALSRNHFLKRMKKISKAIEDMLYSKQIKEKNNNNVNNKYKNFNSFQFIKYQNLPGATPFNMFPLFYGVPIYDKTGVSVTKYYKDKGFITASTTNSCYRDLYFIDPKMVNAENFDHENIPMFCDTNLIDPNMFWAYEQGENSIFRKCLYGRDSHEYMFEYMTQFLEAYKSERKYIRMDFMDAHEATQQVVKYMDEPFLKFLNLIFEKYSDDKTAMIFLSDHGGKLPGPYCVLFVEEWYFEQELSTLFLILPKNNSKYDKNIIAKNEKRYLSDYDVYHTLLDYINVDEKEMQGFRKKYGQSILTEIDGMKRDCDTVGVKDCYCHNYE